MQPFLSNFEYGLYRSEKMLVLSLSFKERKALFYILQGLAKPQGSRNVKHNYNNTMETLHTPP
jgi:hypothetical protein